MKPLSQLFQFLMFAFLGTFSCFPLAYALENFNQPYIVIDTADGAIRASNRESEPWFPASLAKLMSAYVTMDEIRKGNIQPGSPVVISKRAGNMPPSRMGYKTGIKLRVDTALKIVIIKSANDVSVALAEAVGGSAENFVSMMNQSARLLGLTSTNFANTNGLHSPNQYSSARDMAILARRVLIDFPQYAEYFEVPAIKTSKKTYYSYNLLLERFSGANGMKTGFICASGYNMIASAKRGNQQLIAVVMGANSQTERAVLAARLLSEAFAKPEIVVGNLLSPYNSTSAKPTNMRKLICSQRARKARYDPGAGQAVIKSKWLNSREKSDRVLLVQPGGIDARPSKLYLSQLSIPKGKIPVPDRRPRYSPPEPIDANWQTKNNLRNTIAVPLSRPAS